MKNFGDYSIVRDYGLFKDFGRRTIVTKDGKYGMVESSYSSHKFVIPCEYDKIDCNFENVVVTKNNKVGVYNPDGKILVPCQYDSVKFIDKKYYAISKKLIQVEKSGKMGLYDLEGNEILPCEYDAIDPFKGSNWLIIKDKKCGLISDVFRNEIQYPNPKLLGNPEGEELYEELIPCEYDAVLSEEGLVMNNNKHGLHSRFCKIPCEFEDIKDHGLGYYIVKSKDNWGVIDCEGKIVIPIEYEEVYSYVPDGADSRYQVSLRKGDECFAIELFSKIKVKVKTRNLFKANHALEKKLYESGIIRGYNPLEL